MRPSACRGQREVTSEFPKPSLDMAFVVVSCSALTCLPSQPWAGQRHRFGAACLWVHSAAPRPSCHVWGPFLPWYRTPHFLTGSQDTFSDTSELQPASPSHACLRSEKGGDGDSDRQHTGLSLFLLQAC